jgi:cell division protein FtsL
VLWLAAALVVCALLVVELRHRNRLYFAQLQGLQKERDGLNIEWDQLLLEQGTWSEHRRVEGRARSQLHMAMPVPEQIVILRQPAAGP